MNTYHSATMADLTTTATFQDRMFERVRESLSELLTPEEAKALVDKAIEQSLFQKQTVRVGGFSGYDKVLPSRFEELVKECIEPMVRTTITEWLSEHQEEVRASIQGVVEQGITATVIKVFKQETQQPMFDLSTKLQQVINKLGGEFDG